jgi:lipopolysaccharide biosynthesis glycosyltransferase
VVNGRKHALVIINIGSTDTAALSRALFQHYCDRWELDFVELREPRLNIKGADARYNYRNIEKFQAFDVLDDYERILRLDTDVLVSPRAPNVFDVVPEGALGVVFEDVADKRASRQQEAEAVCAAYGGPAWGERRYFNSGVMVFSRAHQQAFRLNDQDRSLLAQGGLGSFKEQNLCNWKAYAGSGDLFELDHRFNHLRFFSDRRYGGHHRMNSFFLHYAGSQRRKYRRMERDRTPLLRGWEGGALPRPPWWHRLCFDR